MLWIKLYDNNIGAFDVVGEIINLTGTKSENLRTEHGVRHIFQDAGVFTVA